MQLRGKLAFFRHLDHWNHVATLILVAISTIALLLNRVVPHAEGAESALNGVLHFIHWFALAVVLLYLSAYFLLRRNVGKELAKLLSEAGDVAIDEPPEAHPRPRHPDARHRSIGITAGDVAFVSAIDRHLVDILLAMNVEGFEGGDFELTPQEVQERNPGLVGKNPRAFMLVRDRARKARAPGESEDRQDFIGYSCVLPLNEVGADVYLRGLIPDKRLPPSILCAEGEPCSAVLAFAVVLDHRIRKSTSLLRAKYSGFLARAVEYHIAAVAMAHAGAADSVTVWAQSEHEWLNRKLADLGFEPASPPKKSADGHALLFRRFEIRAEPLIPLPAAEPATPSADTAKPAVPAETTAPSQPKVADNQAAGSLAKTGGESDTLKRS